MNSGEVLLGVNGIAKRFGSVVALRDASLEVRRGEVHALMGANGAGKSTLVKILTGVHPADGGEMVLQGERRRFRSPAEARQAGIVSVYQDPALVPDLTVAQNLRLALVPPDAVRERLARLGLAELDFSAFARDLPYPVLRLIDLARALASDPSVLLVDEITASLPADLSERIFAMLRGWRERGRSVIFISHRMAEVSALCDRATVLRDGVTVGVTETTSGYAGGTKPNPTYGDHQGYQEAVRVTYDPARVTYAKLLDQYWHNIDPFNPNGQFCDEGNAYRSVIFVGNDSEKTLAETTKQQIADRFKQTVVTEIKPVTTFTPAENYHQNYHTTNPVSYKFYKWNCGRAQRLEQIWGPNPS